MSNGIIVAGVEYVCRTCTSGRTIYVKPRERDGEVVLDLDGVNRVLQYDCPECGCQRTHVAAETLSEGGTQDA